MLKEVPELNFGTVQQKQEMVSGTFQFVVSAEFISIRNQIDLVQSILLHLSRINSHLK